MFNISPHPNPLPEGEGTKTTYLIAGLITKAYWIILRADLLMDAVFFSVVARLSRHRGGEVAGLE
jgi:hypothetical protein